MFNFEDWLLALGAFASGLGHNSFESCFQQILAMFLIDYKSFLSSQNWNGNVDGNNFDLGRDVINYIAHDITKFFWKQDSKALSPRPLANVPKAKNSKYSKRLKMLKTLNSQNSKPV